MGGAHRGFPTGAFGQFAVAQQAGGEIGSLCEYGKVPDRVDTGFGASYELLQQALESTVR